RHGDSQVPAGRKRDPSRDAIATTEYRRLAAEYRRFAPAGCQHESIGGFPAQNRPQSRVFVARTFKSFKNLDHRTSGGTLRSKRTVRSFLIAGIYAAIVPVTQ